MNFPHLFAGAPPWLMAAATIGLVLHIGGGIVGVGSGAAALWFRKGGPPHRLAGKIFGAAMLVGTAMAAALAAVLVARGHAMQMSNLFGGIFAFYLIGTGWVTVRRPPGATGALEKVGLLIALAMAALNLAALPAALSPHGRMAGVPIAAPIGVAVVAVMCALSDLRVILHGGISGVPRIARHVWRMCLGLFVATGSFFLGQQQIMPRFVQGSPALVVLAFAPLPLMIFWLVFIRRRSFAMRAPAAA